MRIEDHGRLAPGRGLGLEIEALRRLEAETARRGVRRGPARPRAATASSGAAEPRDAGERLLVWESARPAVVLPRRGEPEAWVHGPACAARGVALLRRESGGGAVLVGPGCLAVALVLSLDARPWLTDVEYSFGWLLGRLADALALDGAAVRGTDLALGGRKFAGHAQRRLRGVLLHHGVLLYDFDLGLMDRLLTEPARRPAWRGNRTHGEFLTNAPLARDEIVRRLGRLPAALERRAGVSRPPPAQASAR